MLSCVGSFVHFAMVKAIFSTTKSRTTLADPGGAHHNNYSQIHNVQKINAKLPIFQSDYFSLFRWYKGDTF